MEQIQTSSTKVRKIWLTYKNSKHEPDITVRKDT